MVKVTRDRLLNKDLMHSHDIQDIKGFDEALGVNINGRIFGGIKIYIGEHETLYVPALYDYNTYCLDLEGDAIVTGQINIH